MEAVEHKSRPTWSQAPVVPTPAAAAQAQFADLVKPELGELLRTQSGKTFFDTTNGTSLSNPFLTGSSSPKPRYKTGRHNGSPSSPARALVLEDTTFRPMSATASPLRRAASTSTMRASSTFGGGRGDSPFSTTGGDVVRVTTPSSRQNLFSPKA